MKPENLYHSGIIVDDFDETLRWFTAVADYQWTDVVSVDQAVVTPDGELTVPMRMAYSKSEPRLEIIESIPGTIWEPADSGVHHIGYWSDDVEADVASLEANGWALEVKSFIPDDSGKLLWAYCKGPGRPRIELVGQAMKPFMDYWFSLVDGVPQ